MNILGLSSRYNDIVSDGNERLDSDPLRIGTKTDNDLSFIVNNQEQLTLTSQGASITIDEIQGGEDGKIEICDAELEGCGTVEGEWIQIPNPSVTTEVLPDGKPRVNFSSPITDFVMLDNSFTSQDEINISFRVEKLVSAQFSEVAIGYYGNTPPLTFNNPSSAFSEYFGVRAQTPFTDQSNTGTGNSSLSPTRLQPSIGGWNWTDAGVHRVRFTLLGGKATWYVTPLVDSNSREYRVSTCDIALPSLTGSWIPYVYNSTTGNITSNSHISKNTQDIVIDGWDVNEQFNILNELANNETVEQLPRVLKVIDSGTNDWKLERKEFEYTLPNRNGRLITVDDIAVNDIDTELVKIEVQENTVRISQAETDIKSIEGDVVANANDITTLTGQVGDNDTDILNLQNDLGDEITNRTNADTNLQNQITSNTLDITELKENPEPIIYEIPQTNEPIVWDTQFKSSTVSLEGDGTISANNGNSTANVYSVDVIDTEFYDYTLRTTLKDVNAGSIHFIGLFGARPDPVPEFAFVDQAGAGDTLQGGIQFQINHQFQPSIVFRTSETTNTSITDSSGSGDLEVAEDYLEFSITDSVVTGINKNGTPLTFTGANFNMVEKKYYFGYLDLNTFTGSIRIQTQIISKTLRSSVNTDGLNFKLSNLQNQITSQEIQTGTNTLNILELQSETLGLQNQITSNDGDILELQTDLQNIEIETQDPPDLTRLNDAVFIDDPLGSYQTVQWYNDYATANMTFDNTTGVVTKASSTTRDSITSRTSLDLLRYDYDILVNIQQVSGSVIHFGFIENELMIDDYNGGWFQVNSKQLGSEWGDGLSARLSYPLSTTVQFRNVALGFSRQDPTYRSTESFDDLKSGQSVLFSIRNGILTAINRRNSATSAWFRYDFAQFDDGGLTDPKLRFSPLKKYKFYLSDGSVDNSSFETQVTYLEKTRDQLAIQSEIDTRQPIQADIRRTQFYDTDRSSFQYILSEKNRVITIDTSPYPIYFDGPQQTGLELLVELDNNSVESDYDIFVKHLGSNNTLTIVSGGITFDPDEAKINPWCTTCYRIMKQGEEGKTNSVTARKLYSDYNENIMCWTLPASVSSTTANFWAVPFGQSSTGTAHGGWSGRFFIPQRCVLRSLVILGDSEAHNTFLVGSFRVRLYKEDADPYVISLVQTGTLIHDRIIEGRNASLIPNVDVNTRMVEINVGVDPDNISRSTPNVIGISNMGTTANIIPANSTIGLYCTNWNEFDGINCEFKIMMQYQYI